ncbi:Intracellular endo-alpha-(1-_5)-L-arabinanase [compost metagenome]
MAFIDPKTGKRLLYWGSDSRPIKVQEMNADWSDFKNGSSPKDIVSAGTESKYTNLIEGAWVDFDRGKYYLYYSGDNCCGINASYAVLVARSDSAVGPFTPLARYAANKNSVILERDSNWLAPGHNSVFSDAKGNKWIAYHAIRIDKTNPQKISSKREMLIKRLVYQKGWPAVHNKE